MDTKHFLKSEQARSGRHLSLAVGVGVAGGLLLIVQAWALATIVNGVIFQDRNLVAVMPWVWTILGLMLLRAALAYASERVAFQAAAGIKQRVRERLFSHIQALGPVYLSGERSGELSTTITDGVEALEAYFARYLPAMSLAALVPLAILAFVIPLDWRSALVFVLTAPLIPLFMILIGKGAERLNQKQWKELSRMGGHFLDVIQGLTTLKLFNASRREAQVIARISDEYRQATMRVLRVAFLSALALEFFSTISIAIVAVLIGFRLLFGELDFFTGFFILLLAPEFYLPLRSLGTQYHARMNAVAAAERMIEILDQPLDQRTSGNLAFPEGPFDIELRGVHFQYPDGREALRGVDAVVHNGRQFALVGPSGSGKTTLINLLLGFIQPTQGEILVNGVPLSDYDPEQWRSRLAWVPQKPRLFHGSIADNIALGLGQVERSAIVEAAVQANAWSFIDELPLGLDTLVGEGGRGLSGGQIQRLALARAFLRNADLIIFDEPTANLDRHSEALVQQAIARLAEGRTMLTVAHRLHTVQQADRILVLKQGRIVEQGAHAQLSNETGLYRHLLQAQEVIL